MRLHRLTGSSGYAAFGCMWKKGTCFKDSGFKCVDSAGKEVPVQSRITAFWPDGSVKWTAHTGDTLRLGESFEIDPTNGKNAADPEGIKITDSGESFTVNNGILSVCFPKEGKYLFSSVTMNGKTVAENAKCVLIMEEPVETDGCRGRIERDYEGVIKDVTIEEQGPLQCIIKCMGTHAAKNGNERLQFVIRLKINYRLASLNVTHTFVYDGDENKDFLKGLGIRFEKPLCGELYNRHVKAELDHGFLHEGPITLISWKPRVPLEMQTKQMAGEGLGTTPEELDVLSKVIPETPHWDEYDMCQTDSESFTVKKKLAGDLCYIESVRGNRSRGGFAFGSEGGSVILSVRDFWEKYPTGYTVKGLTETKAECTVWLWSPSARPMDFRHYAKRGYNKVCYEGYDYKGADPYGIACTNELAVKFLEDLIPEDKEISLFSENVNDPALYIADPEYYHELRAFGYWSLPDETTESGRFLEGELNKAFKFYEEEVEQRKWYGMFDYGDFMHTYDPVRHVWRYDVGGYAWDNTELVPTLWLWLYFIRTGRKDVYKLAEKLSRHTSEVDVYHIGKYKGMGSRHNVRHWGCPCKEARIAMAGHHRVLYFLTGDRRLEDIFDELKDNEETFLNRDPLGDFYDKEKMVYKSHARSGPDWSSLCSNWMTEWERTGNEAYKNKILIGSDDIKQAPLKLTSGPDFEFDPVSLHLRYIGENTTGGTHLQICMGAPEIWAEMADLLEDEEWKKMLANHGRIYFLPYDEQRRETNGLIGKREFTFPMFAMGLGAYAAKYLNNKELAKEVWRVLFESIITLNDEDGFKASVVKDAGNLAELKEIPWISTNFTAQFCLNVIVAMDFIREEMPESLSEVKELIGHDGEKIFRRA